MKIQTFLSIIAGLFLAFNVSAQMKIPKQNSEHTVQQKMNYLAMRLPPSGFANIPKSSFENEKNIAVDGSFKILNDTDGEVQIYTGSGFVELNKGASTSITCEAGREIRKANKGKKGDVIFTVDESMCGKTIKLSKYL